MRHQVRGRKLGRTIDHRTALMRNLAIALILHERITTTTPKAKELRPRIERLITIAKKDTLAAKQQLMKGLYNDQVVVKKLLKVIAPKYAERVGGYVRIVSKSFRVGDAAPTSIIEFV
jgi:large subunit ribosomal protein L17